ncbi:hypothetical protein KR084_002211 [Drosophila pseudotakahashii]|nr:hypothetical protein KR084_002211 [Drosophila pseudotakahashii]
MKTAVICLVFLVTGIGAQDTIPQVPIDILPPEVITTTTTTEEPTIPTTESSTNTTTESTTEPTTTSKTESTFTTTTTTEPITSSTTESTTTEPTTTSTTTEPTTTSTITESTTTSTTESTTTSTTEPTTRPPLVRPTSSRQPPYTTKKPWSWGQRRGNCYLKDQQEYTMTCYGKSWRWMTNCYHCCYYDSAISGCNKLHKGPCSWYDYNRWIIPSIYAV